MRFVTRQLSASSIFTEPLARPAYRIYHLATVENHSKFIECFPLSRWYLAGCRPVLCQWQSVTKYLNIYLHPWYELKYIRARFSIVNSLFKNARDSLTTRLIREITVINSKKTSFAFKNCIALQTKITMNKNSFESISLVANLRALRLSRRRDALPGTSEQRVYVSTWREKSQRLTIGEHEPRPSAGDRAYDKTIRFCSGREENSGGLWREVARC